MTPTPKALTIILEQLKKNTVIIQVEDRNITINSDLAKTHFSQISPLLYQVLNKFENTHLICIEGIPCCLMPDAAHHLVYTKNNAHHYSKDHLCKTCRYYTSCPGWMQNTQIKARPSPVKNLPQEIVFELTTKCNLNCPLCFNTKAADELSLDRIKSLIDQCCELEIKNVRFTGGEPLLYAELKEVLIYAKSKNHYVILNTNASVLDEKMLQDLAHYVDDMLISLQGFTPATERQLTRGSIDFSKKLHCIAQLNSQIKTVRIGTIISQTLIKNFSKYLYLIQSLGVKHWGLFRPMVDTPSGEFKITLKDYLGLIDNIRQEKMRGYDVVIANPLPFCIASDMDLSRHTLSGAEYDDGHSRLVVDTQGFLKPSYFMPENLGQNIDDAWANPFIKKIHSLEYLSQQCKNCSVLQWCKGGSRHWANLAHDDYFSCDPLMQHLKHYQ